MIVSRWIPVMRSTLRMLLPSTRAAITVCCSASLNSFKLAISLERSSIFKRHRSHLRSSMLKMPHDAYTSRKRGWLEFCLFRDRQYILGYSEL